MLPQFVHVRFTDGTSRVDDCTGEDHPNAAYYHAKALEERFDVDAAWRVDGPARARGQVDRTEETG